MATSKLLIAALLIAISASPLLAQDRPDAQSAIAVTGEGLVIATPDQAWVRVGAESRARVSKDAQQRNADVMTAVQARLAALKIPKEAIKTVGLDLQLEFDYQDGKQTPRGYVARNTIEVRVDDLSRIGEVLDAAVGSGATMISGLRFDVRAREKLQQEALQEAVKSALSKAQAIGAAAGRTLDRVIRIEEEFVGGGPQPMPRVMAMAKADAATPVEAGEIEIRAQVRVTMSMK